LVTIHVRFYCVVCSIVLNMQGKSSFTAKFGVDWLAYNDKLNFGFSSTPCLCLETNVRYLIFYTFKKPEPIFIICVCTIFR